MIRWKQGNHILACETRINAPKRFDDGTWPAYFIRVFQEINFRQICHPPPSWIMTSYRSRNWINIALWSPYLGKRELVALLTVYIYWIIEVCVFWGHIEWLSALWAQWRSGKQVWLQGHWWGFISRNYVVWPTFLLMNIFIALKGSHFWFLFEFCSGSPGSIPARAEFLTGIQFRVISLLSFVSSSNSLD